MATKSIVIEGPIGVGKSSLSKKLADTFGSGLLLEKPADNPFLERFYKYPKQFALPTQLFFLFQRVRQLADANGTRSLVAGRVADFMLAKDPIFARLTLADDEYRLYQQVYHSLNIDTCQPCLMIYLQAPVSVLQQRIKKRKIKYEQDIDSLYLQRLSDAYVDYFKRYDETPLLIVNAAEFNPIELDQDYQLLLDQIAQVGVGRHFFDPFEGQDLA